MISLAFKKILFKFVFWYSKLPPHKRKLINNFLFFSNKRLRSYYTIPKNNCSPVSNIYFIKNYKDFQIIKNSFIGKNIRDSMNSVSGYVPYVKGSTKIYFYHFFSLNYGIRRSMTGQISLVNGKDEVISTSVVNFPSRYNGQIDLSDLFGKLDGTSCILELYHHKINVNHGGHQGHLRFWGVYGNNYSTVHSMPLFPLIIKDDIPKLAERRFYPSSSGEIQYYFMNSNLKEKKIVNDLDGDHSTQTKMLSGFTLQFERNTTSIDFPTSIWHHSTLSRKLSFNKNEPCPSQLVSFPPIENIDAALFLGEFVKTNQKIKFDLFDISNKKIIEKKIIQIDTLHQIKVSDIFDSKLISGNIVSITPLENSGDNIYKNAYLNIQYFIKDRICDGVHAHRYTNDIGDFELNHYSNFQGLKFMHYEINDITKSYFSLWGSRKNIINFRLRIFDYRNNFEKCFNLKTEKGIPVFQINLEDLKIPDGNGVIQLECDTHNPPATSYIYKKEGDKEFLGTCHLTGG